MSFLPEVIQISIESGSCGFVEQSGIQFRQNAKPCEWEEKCRKYTRITRFYRVQVYFITRLIESRVMLKDLYRTPDTKIV